MLCDPNVGLILLTVNANKCCSKAIVSNYRPTTKNIYNSYVKMIKLYHFNYFCSCFLVWRTVIYHIRHWHLDNDAYFTSTLR